MKNTTIVFVCSLAGTLALAALHGVETVPRLGGSQQPVDAMLTHELDHDYRDGQRAKQRPREQVAKVTTGGRANLRASRFVIALRESRVIR